MSEQYLGKFLAAERDSHATFWTTYVHEVYEGMWVTEISGTARVDTAEVTEARSVENIVETGAGYTSARSVTAFGSATVSAITPPFWTCGTNALWSLLNTIR